MTQPQITGFKRWTIDVNDGRKSHILGFFDFEDGRYAFTGCALVRYKNGRVVIHMPKMKHTEICFIDDGLMHNLIEQARGRYMDMGGDPDHVLHPHRGADERGYPTHPKHPNYEMPLPPPIKAAKPTTDEWIEGLRNAGD